MTEMVPPLLDISVTRVRMPQGRESLLNSQKERPRQDIPYPLNQTEPPPNPPEVSLRSGGVDEAQECEGNGRGPNRVIQVRALGIFCLTDNKLLSRRRAGIEKTVRALNDLAL